MAIISSYTYEYNTTWSLTRKEERGFKVSENMALKIMLWPMKEEANESGENYIMRSFIICTFH
jgi:hypothetical protein